MFICKCPGDRYLRRGVEAIRSGMRGNRGSQRTCRILQRILEPELCCPSVVLRQLGLYEPWNSLDMGSSWKGMCIRMRCVSAAEAVPGGAESWRPSAYNKQQQVLYERDLSNAFCVHHGNHYHFESRPFWWTSRGTISNDAITAGINQGCLSQANT